MAASDVLDAYLAEVDASVRFFRNAAQLRPRLGAFLVWGGATADERKLFNSFLGGGPNESRIYGAAVVATCAGLEQFTTELVDEFCEAVNARELDAGAIESLLPGILNNQRKYAGYPLEKVHEPRGYWGIAYDKLVASLASTAQGSGRVVLYGRAFSVNAGGIDGGSFDRAFARTSFKFPWADICRSRSLQKELGTAALAETERELKSLFEDMGRLRNSLAHSQGSEYVSYEKLIRIVAVSRLFAKEASRCVLGSIGQ